MVATVDQYTATDIQVLEGMEAVRRRPGMYIGSTDQRGLHHLIYENRRQRRRRVHGRLLLCRRHYAQRRRICQGGGRRSRHSRRQASDYRGLRRPRRS